MSCELFEQMFTDGYTLPAEGKIVRCIKGLPPGAKLEAMSMQVFFNTGDIALRFSHPDWPDTLPGEAIPIIPVEYAMEAVEPPVLEVSNRPLTADEENELLQAIEHSRCSTIAKGIFTLPIPHIEQEAK